MQIQLTNWGKHNPRNDYKTLPWFRMSARIYRDRSLHGLSSDAKWTWVTLLCIAAEENKGGLVEGDVEWLSDQTKIPTADTARAIEALANRGLISVTYVTRTQDVRETIVDRSVDDRETVVDRSLHNERTNEENKIPPGPQTPRDTASAFDHQLAERWRTEHALRLMPRLRPKVGDWANAVRLLREQDGLTEADIEAVLTFIKADSFWGKNAISPVAVRTRSKNGLKKIENIMLAMKDRPTTVRDSRPVTHLTEEDLANGLY